MKKHLILIFGIIMLAGFWGIAEAEFERPMPPGENPILRREMRERMTEMQARKQTFHEQLRTDREKFLIEVRTRREEWRRANLEKKNEFRMNAGVMMGERFLAAVHNLERAIERIDALLAKLKSEGKDTSEAEELLDDVVGELSLAKEKIADVKELIPESGEEVTPEVFEQIKLGAREAKD